jgi:hypothetical protein
MNKLILKIAVVGAVAGLPAGPTVLGAADLRGSPASMVRQHAVAKQAELPFVRTPAQLQKQVAQGTLVRVPGNEDYAVIASNPYALPEVKLLIERLSKQYRAATGEKLVVTSLTRPASAQPANAHKLSVHPAGMAIDLRVPADPSARRWLESTLLALEGKGVLDATRERRPPHYHLAVFPAAYAQYVARLVANQSVEDVDRSPSLDAEESTEVMQSAVADSQVTAAALGPAGGDSTGARWFGIFVALLGLVGAAAGVRLVGSRTVPLQIHADR